MSQESLSLPDNLGPLAERLYSVVDCKIVSGLPPKDDPGHYVVTSEEDPVTGQIIGSRINKDYLASPVLRAFAKFQGVEYDQSLRDAPVYSSMFFWQPEAACVFECAKIVEATVELVVCLDADCFSHEEQDHPDVKYFSEMFKDSLLNYQVIKNNVKQKGSHYAASRTRTKLALEICRNSPMMIEIYDGALSRLKAVADFIDAYGMDDVKAKTNQPEGLFRNNTVDLVVLEDFYTARKDGIRLMDMKGDFGDEYAKLLNKQHTPKQTERLMEIADRIAPHFKK